MIHTIEILLKKIKQIICSCPIKMFVILECSYFHDIIIIQYLLQPNDNNVHPFILNHHLQINIQFYFNN